MGPAGILFVQLLISLAMSYMLSVMQAAMQDDPKQDKGGLGHLANKKSTDATVPLLYGRCRVGINTVYMLASGRDNSYMHIIAIIGEGPIQGLVRKDGTTFTTVGTQIPAGTNPVMLYLDGELWTEKWKEGGEGGQFIEPDDFVYAEFFNGTADQNVCAELREAILEWPVDNTQAWNDCLRHTAYLYIKLKYDMDKWSGIPDITVIVDGLKLFNPTTNTIAYSQNFALMAYDALTRPSVRGGLGLDNWHGPVPTDPRIDLQSIESARQYCETMNWKGGMALTDDNDFADHFQLILNCFRGELIYSECKYKLKFRDLTYETSELDITDADLVFRDGKSSIKIRPTSDLYDLPNAIEATFLNSDKDYHEDIYLFSDRAAISRDGDVRKESKKILGLNTVARLQPMLAYYLERARWGHIASADLRDVMCRLEAMDIVNFSNERLGWHNKLMRVISVGFTEEQVVSIELQEEAPTLYDKPYNPNQLTKFTTSLPSPTAQVRGVVAATIREESFTTRLRKFTRLILNFERPPDYIWWETAEIWMSIGNNAEWQYMTKSTTGYQLEGVEEGQRYYFKIVSVNIWGKRQDFDSAITLSRLVRGITSTAPPGVTSVTATATGDVLNIIADPIDNTDIIGYEVRMGDTWETSTFLAMLLDRPEGRIPSVRPGYQTIWIAAKNNANLYSSTPVSTTIFIPYPTEYTYNDPQTWDYDAIGTYNNTAHTTHDFGAGATDALICSHTSGVMTGTWTSPTYTVASAKLMHIECEFTSAFTEGTQAWTSLFATGVAWNTVVPTGITWQYIWNVFYKANLNIQLQYGINSVSEHTFNDLASSPVDIDAAMWRIVITVIDPELSANMYIGPITVNVRSYE